MKNERSRITTRARDFIPLIDDEAEIAEEGMYTYASPRKIKAIRKEIEAGGDIFEVSQRHGLAAAVVLGIDKKAGEGIEKSEDPIRRKLQELTVLAVATHEAAMIDPVASYGEKLRAAESILDRQSYKGVQRVAHAHRVELSDETIEKLTASFTAAKAAMEAIEVQGTKGEIS